MKKTRKTNVIYKIIVTIIVLNILIIALWVWPGFLIKNQSDSKKVEIDLPEVSQERLIAEKAGAFAVKQYVYARMKTQELIEYDLKKGSVSELSYMVDETMKAWQIAELAATRTEQLTSKIDNRIAINNTQTVFYEQSNIYYNPFVTVSYAAEEENAATKWAKNISDKFDSYPTNQRIKKLAQDLGTDAKGAYKQLQIAQDILKGDAERDEGDLYKLVENSLLATKSACKVGFFACGTIATGGVLEGAVEAGGFVVGAVDMLVDISSTGSTIILGEDHCVSIATGKVKDIVAPVSSTMGLFTFSSGNSAEKLSYVTDSLLDLIQEKKILGGLFDFNENEKTTTITAIEIDVTDKSPEEVKKELKDKNLPVPTEDNTRTAKEVVKKLEDDMDLHYDLKEVNKYFDNLLDEFEKINETEKEAKEQAEKDLKNNENNTTEKTSTEKTSTKGVPKAKDIVGTYNISGISIDSMFGDSDFLESYEFYFDNNNKLHWVSADALTNQEIDVTISYNNNTGIASYSDEGNDISSESTFKFQLEDGKVKVYFERMLNVGELGTNKIQAEGYKQ